MLSDLLTTLGALTLGGAVAVILFAVTARASRTRYAARWRCWIWVLLCLRLAIPFSALSLRQETTQAPIQLSVPSDTVVYEYYTPDVSQPAIDITPDAPAQSAPETPVVSTQSDVPPQEEVDLKPQVSISVSEIIVIVWLVGMVIMAIWAIISHLRFTRYLRRWARPMQDSEVIRLYNSVGDQLNVNRRPSLRACAGLRAPMLAGVFRPVLLLPEESLNEGPDTMRFILVHELTHYKRRDILLKTLALLANIVHWFNPFMWYMMRLVERDTELACDEAALRQLPPEDHAAYGRTILNAVERLKLKAKN